MSFDVFTEFKNAGIELKLTRSGLPATPPATQRNLSLIHI